MDNLDIDEIKYRLGRTARQFDSQMFVTSVEEHYDGETYKVFFQRGYHSYILEVEGDRFRSWFAGDDEEEPEDMVKALKLAAEELAT